MNFKKKIIRLFYSCDGLKWVLLNPEDLLKSARLKSFRSLGDMLSGRKKKARLTIINDVNQTHPRPLLVSIIMPVLNSEETIPKAIKSIQMQSYPHWELLIIDDGSTDHTLSKIVKLAEQDKLASIGQMAAMLAHEIRNPMQTIAQAAELMGLEQKDSNLENIVTSEIRRLNRLVSDMLDYAHPLHPNPEPLPIKMFIEKTLQQIDLSQTYDIQTNIMDSTLTIDPDHLRLVLDNLLRNAIRVSPEPKTISIDFMVEDDDWYLRVKDQGQGIAENMKDTLFQPFQTGHKQGTGLGLATVWQVCQANGWQVSIDETLTIGACFIVQGHIHPTQYIGEEQHG